MAHCCEKQPINTIVHVPVTAVETGVPRNGRRAHCKSTQKAQENCLGTG